ncbi:MAG: type II toxin-antitoxin system RelE/ParE family toxin [Candidatus Methanoperedens sp.]
MSFGIFLSTEAAKFLKNLDKEDKYRIVEKLKLLENGPFSLPYKKIKGRENTYRIRIGDFRAIYSIRGNEIRVLKIGLRKGIYK